MPVTIIFNKIKEKKPKHEQEIIFLEGKSSFGVPYFEPRQVQVKYYWDECILEDEVLESTGTSICYNEDDKFTETYTEDGMVYVLKMGVDGITLEDEDLWCDVEDYWKSFEEDKAV